MSIDKFNPRTITLIVFIFVAGAIRTYLSADQNMYGLSDFSPVGAMAIFGGVYFNKSWKAYFFPLFTLLMSDLVLHLTVFSKYGNGFLYEEWYFVYGAFALMVAVGRLIKKVTIGHMLLATIAIVLIHWLVTDFPVWNHSTTYPQTISGYWQCLVAAIPFEWRFLTGTLVYSGVFFGAFEWLQNKYPTLAREN